jgi:hypothetical protein
MAFLAGASMMLSVVVVASAIARHVQRAKCDPAPQELISWLSLVRGERPRAYELVSATKVLADLGLSRNPDLMGKQDDIAALADRGGEYGFAAVYGVSNEVRLMLNGVYFRNAGNLTSFADFQRAKHRRIAAFRKRADRGSWLLIVARDPELDYTDKEREALQQGLTHYRDRLALDLLFDDLSTTNSL